MEDASSAPPPLPAGASRQERILRVLAIAAEVGTILLGLGALGLWCSVPNTSRFADENPASTAFIDLRRDEAADTGTPFALEWKWRPLGKISRYLRAAVIYAEDYNFYRHNGVDWAAVEDAIETNLDRGALAIGGSTITQQLAKNLYLSPRRSMIRKLRELLIAYALEDHLTKQRILELYLNVVEWGPGVFGAEAAAQHWFHHSAQSLTPAEAARLAIALPNPIARAPNVRDAELTRKAVRIIHLLRMQGLLDPAQERTALDQVGAPNEATLPTRTPPPPPPATTTTTTPAPAPTPTPTPTEPEPEPPPTEPSGSAEPPE